MSPVVLKYQTGEEIKKGDRVMHFGEPGEIELAASDLGDPETDWYIQEYGGGVMIIDAVVGRTFVEAGQIDNYCDRWEFVSKADAPEVES
jgi:hypothetical protein